MTIKKLPPQLANQIAAGEVVERPASVVKELVENALDADASKVEIDIERGGHKRILIRDNGKGIGKEQLTLALSRHATSKISNIDDLEAIMSLGFRGEALASISSVSRLTMTSKPAGQNEAWSAIAEGLAMDVDIKPAAHPDGTSVDVVDLFFNTPARRKFLRAEKTEFNHIETLIKRIALSRPDVSFILKHNQKVVRKYRAHSAELGLVEQKSKRISEVISSNFIDSASVFTSQYDQVNITVWIKSPELCGSVNPAQYSFVNGRMMRDKLIQHAIRQSYGQLLHPEQLPEYVIFIELPANEVDVNVHPAKHEVRFHHARLLHDLIVKTIKDALAVFQIPTQVANQDRSQELDLTDEHQNDVANQSQDQKPDEPALQNATAKPAWLAEPNHEYQTAVAATEIQKTELVTKNEPRGFGQARPNASSFSGLRSNAHSTSHAGNDAVAKSNFAANQMHQALAQIDQNTPAQSSERIDLTNRNKNLAGQFSVLFVQQLRYAYCQIEQDVWLVDVQQYVKSSTVNSQVASGQRLTKTPLLVPVRLKLTEGEKRWCTDYLDILSANGFEVLLHQYFLIVKQVPAILRSNEGNNQSSQTLPMFFNRIMAQALTAESLVENILDQQAQLTSAKQVTDFLLKKAQQADFITELKDSALKLDAESLLSQ
jgi:DNA mismatch repair protein MutL